MKRPPKLPHLPKNAGVYLMKHDVTGDTYVGSSGDIRGRCQMHLGQIAHGKHTKRVMAVCQSHGPLFTFSVLELTGDADPLPREEHWIRELSATLNRHPAVLKPQVPRADGTLLMNFRLRKSTTARMRDFCERHPSKPTLSGILNAALAEFLENHRQPAAV